MGREHVGIAQFIVRATKVFDLDPAHLNERLEQEVGFPETEADSV